MRRGVLRFLLVVVLLVPPAAGLMVWTAQAGSIPNPDVEKALQSIRAEGLRANTRFLSDDALEGRGTGTPGHELAARYMATQFEALGLEPAGEAGSYFQPVPLRKGVVVEGETSLQLLRGGTVEALEWGKDYVGLPDYSRERLEVTGAVVFVGFGVSAPEAGYDDYSNVDTRGKLVALLRGAPASLPHNQRAHYASTETKIETAARHGAVGILYLTSPKTTPERWERYVRLMKGGGMRWVDPSGVAQPVMPATLQGRAYVGPAGIATLFEGAQKSLEDAYAALDESRPASFELPGRVRLRTVSRLRALTSPNVAAVLPGSDPTLRHEYVIYSAHLDHLGVGEAVEGDSIYNGAMDNALGSASLLEVARGFAALPTPPARSVLFLAVTAEEEGLLGSDYFAHYPTVPIGDIVADVNLDSPLLLHPLEDVVAFGGEHSTLGPVVEEAAAELGLKVTPDPFPEETFFVRSDQYSFVKQGVPSVYMEVGWEAGAAGEKPRKLFEEWIRTRYHTPQDDMSQAIDFDAGAKLVQLNFLIGYRVASEPVRPAWNPGDFFGEHYSHATAGGIQ